MSSIFLELIVELAPIGIGEPPPRYLAKRCEIHTLVSHYSIVDSSIPSQVIVANRSASVNRKTRLSNRFAPASERQINMRHRKRSRS